MTAPLVFDRMLVRRNLRRASRSGLDDFLGTHVAADLLDRLRPVQRQFESVLDFGTAGPQLASGLRNFLPSATIVRAAPVESTTRFARTTDVIADVETNPFRSGTFDLVVSALALHAVNDLPGALTQIRRTLKADGLFLAALLGGQTLQELRQVLAEAEVEATGGASPRVAPFADIRDLGNLLQRAGFGLPVTDVDRLTVRYGNLFALARDLRGLAATNALADRSRKPVGRGFFLRAAELYATRFADVDGRIRATFDVMWLSGWAPHESQQKPLKPGSAKMRLADALPRRGGGQPPS